MRLSGSPPNPSDCGLAVGGLLLNSKPKEQTRITYSGIPILDLDELPAYAKAWNAAPVELPVIAKLLAEGAVIGVMRGTSEHGPRALGHRSILCNPGFPGIRDRLNAKIKFRESFRPFAPATQVENVGKYFECTVNDMSYMSFNIKVRSAWRTALTAAVHVDGTARVQTVSETDCSWLYQLLKFVERFTGIGVLLNTSFNIKGRPILSTISEALECLRTVDFDYCVIEEFLFAKVGGS